jgi:hypothetical protein
MALDLDGYIPATGSSDPAFYNAVLDAPVDPTVPEILEDTREVVTDYLDLNREWVEEALNAGRAIMETLATLSLPADLPDPPLPPNITSAFAASMGLGFTSDPDFGEISAQIIEEFNPETVTIPSITEDLPVYTSLGLTLNIPDTPTYIQPVEPTEPTIEPIDDIGEPPESSYGAAPELEEILSLTLPTITTPEFGAEVPVFTVAAPEPVIQWTEPVYTSDVKDAVELVLAEMLAGGTGLPSDVEQALWDRARAREDVAAAGAIDAVIEEWAARGFIVPTGLQNKIVQVAREEAARKVNSLSRDIAIEQANLEQKNRQFAVTAGLDYERVFTAVFLAVVERNFQIAKFAVETQIQVYNLQVTAFRVELEVFNAQIAKYKADLEVAGFTLLIFRAQVEAEKAKSELNLAKVAAYKAKVDAYGAEVEAYKALVQAVGVQADIQKTKADVYRSQIEGMVAKINGERAKFDAYDSRIKAETAKVSMEGVNAQVYETQVRSWGAATEVLLKQSELEFRENQQQLEWNIANMRRVSDYTSAQLAVIQGRLAGFNANVSRSVASFNAQAETQRLNVQATASSQQTALGRYQVQTDQWKTRSQNAIQFGLANIESQRAIGQMISNWISGAMAGTHVSAGISASASAGQSSSRGSTSSTSQGRNVNENSQYTVAHNYQHRV